MQEWMLLRLKFRGHMHYPGLERNKEVPVAC